MNEGDEIGWNIEHHDYYETYGRKDRTNMEMSSRYANQLDERRDIGEGASITKLAGERVDMKVTGEMRAIRSEYANEEVSGENRIDCF